MRLEEKLRILANCDFSSSAKWKRVGDIHHPPNSIQGFRNSLNT